MHVTYFTGIANNFWNTARSPDPEILRVGASKRPAGEHDKGRWPVRNVYRYNDKSLPMALKPWRHCYMLSPVPFCYMLSLVPLL
jgi:hypothetical protein